MVSLLLISIFTGIFDKITRGPSTYKNSNVQLWTYTQQWKGPALIVMTWTAPVP